MNPLPRDAGAPVKNIRDANKSRWSAKKTSSYLHNVRYHRAINYGNVSSYAVSITQRVSSSADLVAARDLSFLLDCQEQRRRGRTVGGAWSPGQKRKRAKERYRDEREILRTNVFDLTLLADLGGSIAPTAVPIDG
ncbi:hypothetical protein KM043_006817 [Ampulex compressa]|nr:hypothetical protein KM043_006817 [Ampulex compressa]